MKLTSLALSGVAIISLAGCETTSSRAYQVVPQNTIALQSQVGAGAKKVSIGNFSTAEGVDAQMTCRALGALEVAPGQTAVEYLRSAFQAEFLQGGLYDQVNGQQIQGVVEKLDFNSFGTGSWKVSVTLKSASLPEGLSVATDFSFKTSYSALRACQNVIDAFQPATAQLIEKAITHPDFRKLTGG